MYIQNKVVNIANILNIRLLHYHDGFTKVYSCSVSSTFWYAHVFKCTARPKQNYNSCAALKKKFRMFYVQLGQDLK